MGDEPDLAGHHVRPDALVAEAVGLPTLDALERLRELGVGATHAGGKVRMVTHVDVDDDGVAFAVDAWRSLASDVAKEG